MIISKGTFQYCSKIGTGLRFYLSYMFIFALLYSMSCHVKPERVVTVPEYMILWWEKAFLFHWTKLMATMQVIKYSCMKTSKFHPRSLNAIRCGPIDNWTRDWFTLESHRVAPTVLFTARQNYQKGYSIMKDVLPTARAILTRLTTTSSMYLFITKRITYSCITKLLRILPSCGFCCREFWKARKEIVCKFSYNGCSWTGQVTIASFEIHINSGKNVDVLFLLCSLELSLKNLWRYCEKRTSIIA